MDIEKFTERARGFLQAAQTIAIREFHQQITPDMVRILDGAQQAATKAGDEYVAQDRLLLAIAASDTPAARALRNAGANPQALEKAVTDIRKGRKVTSANAESTF